MSHWNARILIILLIVKLTQCQISSPLVSLTKHYNRANFTDKIPAQNQSSNPHSAEFTWQSYDMFHKIHIISFSIKQNTTYIAKIMQRINIIQMPPGLQHGYYTRVSATRTMPIVVTRDNHS